MSRRELLKNARAGNSDDQLELACDYGFKRPKDRWRAAFWYRKAAENGNVEAQNYFAECLREGVRVKKSRKEAAIWFRRSGSGDLVSREMLMLRFL